MVVVVCQSWVLQRTVLVLVLVLAVAVVVVVVVVIDGVMVFSVLGCFQLPEGGSSRFVGQGDVGHLDQIPVGFFAVGNDYDDVVVLIAAATETGRPVPADSDVATY